MSWRADGSRPRGRESCHGLPFPEQQEQSETGKQYIGATLDGRVGGVIWNVNGSFGRLALNALFAAGWLTVLATTFLINHFDLFGLRQVWLHLLGRTYGEIGFRTPGPYRYVRHPLYVGWLLVFWSAPVMTFAHLVFAIATTVYILVAIQFEGATSSNFTENTQSIAARCR